MRALLQRTSGARVRVAALFPLAILATFAGVWLVRRVDPERFYTLVYGLLVLVGGKLVVDGVSGLR